MSEPTTIVFINGSPSAPSAFVPLASALAPLQSRIVALPGYPFPGGDRRPAPDARDWTFDLVAEDLEAQLREAGALLLVGYSSGAYHALHLAARRALDVRAVVSLAGFANLDAEEKAGLVGAADWVETGEVDIGQIFIGRMLTERGQRNHAWCKEVASWPSAAPSRHYLASELRAIERMPDLRPRLADLDIPIVGRVGELDLATPVIQTQRFVEGLRRSIFEMVPGVGHALLLEDLNGCAESIRRVCDGQSQLDR